jgi:gamma-tubulin complex component 3
VFQGIAGRHIKFDPRSEQYVVDPGLPIKSTVKDLVLSLCELGWLYTKVEVYIQRAEADRFRGLVMHALGFALQEELHDYYRLLAVLEQELGRRVKLLQSDHQNKGGSSSGLTLMRLRAWVAEPLERMYLMARIVESAAPLTGGALASRLHGHCKHGDPTVRVFTLRLMTSVCAPLNAIITRWLLHGELQDGHREFFIGSNIDNVAMGVQSEDAWHKLYYLDYAMLPSFISVDLASRILVIGKSIGFIRMCVLNLGHMSEERPPSKQRGVKMARESVSSALRGLNTNKDGSLVMDSPLTLVTDTTHLMAELFARGKELNECLQGLLDFGGNLRLSSLLEEISTSIDRKLLNMMESRYYLSTHLSSLKKFMLLGQGDFVTCLMDALGPELKKKATLLYRHNLTGILEGALRASNAQFEPGYVLERVGVRLLDASPGDTGWEVFTLDYHIDSPLSAVVHPGAMIQYRSAFNMLWKLKRLEWSLSASWKQLMSFNHMRGSVVVPKLKAILHHCSLSRARMMHVVNNLCAFMQFEVIESAWSNFNAALMSAQRLDDVISAHDAYLADIHKRALLDAYHESFNVQVQLLLQAMLRFCSLEESLIADAMASIARRRALLSDIKTRSQKREERFEDDDVDSEANVTTPGRDGNMTGEYSCGVIWSLLMLLIFMC